MNHNKDKKLNIKLMNETQHFNKFITDRKVLQYCLGGLLYMPSKQDIVDKIVNKKITGLTSMSMCFEDAIREADLAEAENNVISILDSFNEACENGKMNITKDMPLFFLRVRSPKQFKDFTNRLNETQFKYITGFIFPKFDSTNADKYIDILDKLNKKYSPIYGMPILESRQVMYKETRLQELTYIKNILNKYSHLILNVRVGGTDFSSIFGLRRKLNYSIYDIRVVSDCLIDIVNFFARDDKFVVSAPVWEYFSKEAYSKEILGLIKEVDLDIQNGFIGKTVIHPYQLPYVNMALSVSYEEYEDAKCILKNQGGGVIKGVNNNKMNETNPHLNWANKIITRANIYGVRKED